VTWDPTGRQVAYTDLRSGNILVRPSDGSGEARPLTKGGAVDHLDSWSPDGRELLFHRHAGPPADQLVLSLSDGEPAERAVLAEPSAEEGGRLSPDGNWLAYYSDESGRPEIYITPYPGPGGKFPVSTDGANMPVWAGNGELFYRSRDLRRLMAVKISTKPTLEIGKPELLFEGPYNIGGAGGSHPNYDVTSEGQRFLMVRPDAQSESSGQPRSQINVVENWFDELRQRVPVR
jgi:Tol biopolymer transport system component